MLLKKGSTGEQVKELQRLLGIMADGVFGPHTENTVKAFQTIKGLVADGIVGEKTWGALQTNNQYQLIRRFNTDIHVYITNPKQRLLPDLGMQGKRETLTEIISRLKICGMNIYAGINGQFFDMVQGGAEFLGSFGHDGLHWKDPDSTFIDFIVHADGRSEVKKINGNAECVELQKENATYFGTSYALLIDGKINLINSELFSHSTGRNSRTMIGQRADGTFVLAVADRNWGTSAGLMAHEQALVMQELGCVNAVNMDGGGSSEMVVGGRVMNKPDDGKERRVGSAILVIEKE